MGRSHARVYSELASGKGEKGAYNTPCEFVGLYDASADTAKKICQQHGCHAFGSLEELVEEADAVSIATPTFTHLEIAELFLSKGKAVLVEKPIANTTAEARKMAEMAKAHNAVLQVGHIERFNPVMKALEDRLTKPLFIESHRLSPYPGRSTDISVVMDLMIHDIEVILHIVRSPVASLDAVGVPVLSKSEDIANARIRFESGCVANITTSRISPDKMRKIRVFQDDAYLSLDYQDQSGEIYRKGMLGISRDTIPVEKQEPLKMQLDSFIYCAATKSDPKVSGDHASAALQLAAEITEKISDQLSALNQGASS